MSRYAIVLLALTLNALQYSCTNPTFEVTCTHSACTCERDAFTPINVTLDEPRHWMSVCAYSGCWEGRVMIRRWDHYRIVRGRHLRFTSSVTSSRAFLLIPDTHERRAMISGGGFAMPLECTESSQE